MLDAYPDKGEEWKWALLEVGGLPEDCPTPRWSGNEARGESLMWKDGLSDDDFYWLPHRVSCERVECPWCGPRLANDMTRAIAMAEPGWELVLRLALVEWGPLRTNMNRLLAEWGEGRAAWYVVRPKRGCGSLIRMVVWRPPSHPVEWLDPAEGLVQCGRRRKVITVDVVSRYPSLASYLANLRTAMYAGFDLATIRLREHLDLNGGRLLHTTRGFWRTADGAVCGKQEALRWARRTPNWGKRHEPRLPARGLEAERSTDLDEDLIPLLNERFNLVFPEHVLTVHAEQEGPPVSGEHLQELENLYELFEGPMASYEANPSGREA